MSTKMFDFDSRLRSVPVDQGKFKALIDDLYEKVKTNDLVKKSSMLADLGCNLRISGELDLAEKFLNESLELISKHELGKSKETRSKILLGHVLQFKKEFEKSNKLFDEVLNDCKTIEELSRFLHFAYQHSGKNQFDQGNYEVALDHFEKALNIRVDEKAPKDQIESSMRAIKRTKELIKREKNLASMYDNVAAIYGDKVKESQYIGPKWLINNFSDSLKGSKSAYLDLACADGINIQNLSKITDVSNSVGLDISQKMLAIADDKRIYKELINTNLDKGLPYFKNKTFDVIISLGFLEFVTNIDFCLDEISRVAADSAELYASFQLYDPDNKYAPKTSRSGDVIHYAYSQEEVYNELQSRDFNILKSEKITGYIGGYPCQYLMIKAKKNKGKSNV